jgi:hypothetical protein
LSEFPGAKIKPLVVWEAVVSSDTEPPSNRDLERVSDPRAVQFWDKDGMVSRAIREPIVAGGQDDKLQRYRNKGDLLWDTVAVYPAGGRWGDAGPKPKYTGGPVAIVLPDLRQALRQAVEKANSADRQPQDVD